MRIHIMDIVQPPGISIPPDIVPTMPMVIATATTNADETQR
jgi:hypothetical protein